MLLGNTLIAADAANARRSAASVLSNHSSGSASLARLAVSGAFASPEPEHGMPASNDSLEIASLSTRRSMHPLPNNDTHMSQ